MPVRSFGLGLLPLEDRSLMTVFGTPWADAEHLSLSFVPDGADARLGPNALSRTLGERTSRDVWEKELLRAFQTWASVANINLGFRSDGGQALGTHGAVQGDGRFGDIRVAAAPLGEDAGAHASPFHWSGTTFAGDVVLNSNANFAANGQAGNYDIFSVALHEAGHALGLDHSDDPLSAMNENYRPLTGLAASDIAAIQAIYGARPQDLHDQVRSNDSTARATVLQSGLLGSLLGGSIVVDGDITTRSDVDLYRFTTPLLSGLVTVNLQADGLSLLSSKVTILNSSGAAISSARIIDPRSNDLGITFRPSLLGGTYYVKVEGATTDVFATGEYRLTVRTSLILVPLLTGLLSPVLDGHSNDTLSSATDLGAVPSGNRFDANYRGSIEDGTDVDTYKLRAPSSGDASGFNVIAWGTDTAPLTPRIQVFDANRNPVGFQVLSNDKGLFSVRVPAPTPGALYYLAVTARDAGARGAYFLGADFNSQTMSALDRVGGDAVAEGTSRTASLALDAAGVYQFGLTAVGATGGVTMTVKDANGNTVFALDATAGQPFATTVRHLAKGTYTVTYTRRAPIGTAGALEFDLYLQQFSDEIGPYASSTNGSTSTSGAGYNYGSTSPPTSPPPPPTSSTQSTQKPPSTSSMYYY